MMPSDCVYGLEILNPDDAVVEPVTLADAKKQLAISDDDTVHDARIQSLIPIARQFAERHTRRQIVPKNLRLSLKWLPSEIWLPGGVVRSIESVQYVDTGDDWQTASASLYESLLSFSPPRLVAYPNQVMPSVGSNATVLARVNYAAGWADAASVPGPIKQAILLAVGTWFERRGDDVKFDLPAGTIALLNMWELPSYN